MRRHCRRHLPPQQKARREGRDITAGDFEREYEDSVGPKIFEEDRQLLQPYFDHFLHKARQDEGLEPKPKAQEDTQATQPTTQKVTDPDDPRIDEARHTAQTLGLNALFTTSDSKVHEGRRMEGTKRAAYGYIETGTGEIVINTDNCHDAEHVLTTLLHEGVAHYGLRKLFGSDFNTFLDNVYGNCTDDMRRAITERAEKEKAIRQKNGITISDEEALRIGVDEYIASLAEKTDFTAPERTLWNRIKQLFLRMLRTKGIRITTITDDDLRNILREAYKNLKEENGIPEEYREPESIASPEQPDHTDMFSKPDWYKNVKPSGRSFFGNIYTQFRQKAREAFQFLSSKREGDLKAVYHRQGIGNIDLVWGDDGGGFKHILNKHIGEGKSFANVEEAEKAISDIINNGEVDFENGDKVKIVLGSKLVTIRKNYRRNGKKIADKNWILTAYDELSADSESPITNIESLAGSATDNSSTDKVTDNISSDQANQQKSSSEGEDFSCHAKFHDTQKNFANCKIRKNKFISNMSHELRHHLNNFAIAIINDNLI